MSIMKEFVADGVYDSLPNRIESNRIFLLTRHQEITVVQYSLRIIGPSRQHDIFNNINRNCLLPSFHLSVVETAHFGLMRLNEV